MTGPGVGATRPGVLIRVLGQVEVRTPVGEIGLGQSQALLLAQLVAAGPSGATKAHLYEQLYPDVDLASGEQSVVMRVHRLRTKLAESTGQPVITAGPRYGIHEHCAVDWWQLDAATNSGDVTALVDTGSAWAEPFDGLVEDSTDIAVAREQARASQRHALCLLAPTAPNHRLTDIAAALQRRVDATPWDEQLAAGTAMAWYRLGRQPQALEAVARCRRELLDAHGLDGGRLLDDIELTILRHDELSVVAPSDDAIELATSATGSRGTDHSADRPFVGRLVALEQLERMVATSSSAPGTTSLVIGAAGAGKSALVRALSGRYADAVDVHTGRCRVAAGEAITPAYGPWLEAFPDLVADLLELQRTEALQVTRVRFWDRVRARLAEAASRRPIMVVLEDLHAADGQSAALLRHLASEGLPMRVTVVATARDHIADDRLPQADQRVDLGPLSLNDITDLVAHHHPDESPVSRGRFATRVTELSHGNALGASVLCRHAAPGLDPASLSYEVSTRGGLAAHLDALVDDHELAQVMGVAALIGFDFDVAMLAEVLALEPPRVRSHLDTAADLVLCRPASRGRWQFDHLLIADHFATRLGVLQPLICARLARHPRAPSRGVVRYVTGAGDELDHDFVVQTLTRAADKLELRLAFEEATGALQHLLEIVDDTGRGEVLTRLAATTCRTGALAAAQAHRQEAFAIAAADDDHDGMLAAALAGLPSGEYVGGEHDRLAMLEQVDPARTTTADRSTIDYWRLRMARLCDRNDIARRVLASTESRGRGQVALHFEVERLTFAAGSRDAAPIRSDLQLLADDLPAGVDHAHVMVRVLLAAMAEQDPDAPTALFDQVREEVRRDGSPRARWAIEVIAATMVRVGMRRGTSDHDSARRVGLQYGIPDVFDSWSVQVWVNLWLAGHHEQALGLVDASRDVLVPNVAWRAATAVAAAHVGALDRAVDEGEAVAADLARDPDSLWAPVAAALLAEVAAILGDGDHAATADAVLAPRSGQALVLGLGHAHLGPVDRYLALAATARGDDSAGLLAGAVGQADRSGATLWTERIREQAHG